MLPRPMWGAATPGLTSAACKDARLLRSGQRLQVISLLLHEEPETPQPASATPEGLGLHPSFRWEEKPHAP